MKYNIAGIYIDIPDIFTTAHFHGALSKFATTDAREPDLLLKPASEESLVCEGPDLREIAAFDFEDADADCRFGRDAGGYTLIMTPRRNGPPVRFRKQHGGVYATTDITEAHHPALFRFGLWVIYNLAALPRRAVAVHTSTIVYDGGAVLFLGESGTGKSTHTRLWREHIAGATLLNDDSPVVRISGEGLAEVCGSPWSGKTPCYIDRQLPIRGIVRLSQAPANKMRRLRPIEAIGALLPSCPPMFLQDEGLQDAMCALISEVVAQVPVYHLECLPDKAAAELSFQTVFGR